MSDWEDITPSTGGTDGGDWEDITPNRNRAPRRTNDINDVRASLTRARRQASGPPRRNDRIEDVRASLVRARRQAAGAPRNDNINDVRNALERARAERRRTERQARYRNDPRQAIFERVGRAMEWGAHEGFAGIVGRNIADWLNLNNPTSEVEINTDTLEALRERNPRAVAAIERRLRDLPERLGDESIIEETRNRIATLARDSAEDFEDSGGWSAVPEFVGGVVGSTGPEYLVPVARLAGVGGRTVGGAVVRGTGRAAQMAGVNAATDSVYQLENMAAGIRDEFDPNRVAMSAAFGAGFSGARDVARRLTGRSSVDGRDTTPTDETPTTRDAAPVSPDELVVDVEGGRAQIVEGEDGRLYHQYENGERVPVVEAPRDASPEEMRLASEANEFLSRVDRNAEPEPPRVDVMDEGVRETVSRSARPTPDAPPQRDAPAAPRSGGRADEVREQVNELTSTWRNAPEFEVVNRADEIADPEIREAAMARGDDVLGFVGPDGRVRIIADNIRDPEEISAVTFHEGLGHHGLSQRFADDLDNLLDDMYRNSTGFQARVDEWMRRNPGAYGDEVNPNVRAAEEVLAEMSEAGRISASMMDRVRNVIKDFGRRMGLRLDYSDREIASILSTAHDAVIRGVDGGGYAPSGFRMMRRRPVSEYNRDGATRAGNINLERLASARNIAGVLREVSEGIDTGRVSRQEISRLADDLALTPAQAAKVRVNFSPEQALALRRALVTSGERVVDLSRKIARGQNVEANEDAFVRALATHSAIQEKVAGLTAHAGRLLNSLGIRADGKAEPLAALRFMSSRADDDLLNPSNLQALARRITELSDNSGGNRQVINTAIRDAFKPRASDYFFSMWYNWRLLSSVWTHFRNIAGTSLNQIYDINVDHLGAALAGQLVRGKDRIPLREVLARNVGAVMGLRAAFNRDIQLPGKARPSTRMGAAWTLGTPLDFVGRNERPTTFKGEGAQQFLETPTRSMAAMDEVFRNVAALSNFYGMAYRIASREGLKGNALRVRMHELVQNPTRQMMDETVEYAQRIRFQDKMGWAAHGLDRLRTPTENTPRPIRMMQHLLRTQIPFLRTPASIMRTAIRRSPLGFMDSTTIRDWKAGGERRQLAASRMVMGTLVLSALATYMGSENDTVITGRGPTDPRRREERQSGGWRQNTIGGVPYTGLDPATISISTLATIFERMPELSDKDWDVAAARMVIGVADSLSDQTFTQGLADIFGAVDRNDNGAAISNAITNLISPVPGFARDIQRMDDPVMRDTQGDGSPTDRIAGRIQNEIPITLQRLFGMEELPARHTIYGEQYQRPDTPFTVENIVDSPVVAELERLNEASPQALVSPPNRNVTVDGERRRLTAAEYQEYVRLSGTWIVEDLQEDMNSPEWQEMTDDERMAAVKTTVRAARRDARRELFNNENTEDGDDPAPPSSRNNSTEWEQLN